MSEVGLGHRRRGEHQPRLLDHALSGGDDLRRGAEVNGRYLHLLVVVVIVATPEESQYRVSNFTKIVEGVLHFF